MHDCMLMDVKQKAYRQTAQTDLYIYTHKSVFGFKCVAAQAHPLLNCLSAPPPTLPPPIHQPLDKETKQPPQLGFA